jgi:hypothetical protein
LDHINLDDETCGCGILASKSLHLFRCQDISLTSQIAMTSSQGTRRKQKLDSDDESHVFPSTLFDSAKEIEWESLTKRQRTVVLPRKAKKRTEIHQPSLEDHDRDSAPWLGDSDRGLDSAVSHSGDPPFNDNGPLQPPISATMPPELLLEKYVEAVEAQVAGFYHLERNLFVFQGWDYIRGEATVSMGFLSDSIPMLKKAQNSLLGTTLNTAGLHLPMSFSWLVPVPLTQQKVSSAFIKCSSSSMRLRI